MRKTVLIIIGLCFVVLACLGLILPGLPTTPLLVVAAACFAKSSPRLYGWLLSNRVFAPIIKNWKESRSMPRKTKRMLLFMIFLAGTLSFILIENLYLKLLVLVLLLFPIGFISRLRVTENILQSKKDSHNHKI